MSFDWTGKLEYVSKDNVYPVVKTELIELGQTTRVTYAGADNIQRTVLVWTATGDTWRADSQFSGVHYVRKAAVQNPKIEDMTDAQIAELLRTTDKLANKLTALLYQRGYTIHDEHDDPIHEVWNRHIDENQFQKISRPFKTETIVKNVEL